MIWPYALEIVAHCTRRASPTRDLSNFNLSGISHFPTRVRNTATRSYHAQSTQTRLEQLVEED
eukprot:16163-Eustigmatos_ZCMA.PRE.1